MSSHRCERCNGKGLVCARCGRPHDGGRKFCSGFTGCGSRAKPLPCPGFLAGFGPDRKRLASWVPTEAEGTSALPHFVSYVTCDCCEVRYNGSSYRGPGWDSVQRMGKSITLCDQCLAHHKLLISMALEQVFIDRERGCVGLAWTAPDAPKFGPVAPPWLRCSGCGGDFSTCQPLWSEQRKCCPDCSHSSASAPVMVRRRGLDGVMRWVPADSAGVAAVVGFDGIRIHAGNIPIEASGVLRGTIELRDENGAIVSTIVNVADEPPDAEADYLEQRAEDIRADVSRVMEGINAPDPVRDADDDAALVRLQLREEVRRRLGAPLFPPYLPDVIT